MDACIGKVACTCAGRIVVECDYIRESFAYFLPLGNWVPGGTTCDPNDPRQGRDIDSGAPDADARDATVGSPRLVFVEQSPIDFGIVSCPPSTRSVTVRNLGTAPSGVVTASLEDATDQPFEIVQNGCGSTGLDAGGSCVITLRVAPPLTARPGAAALVVVGSLGGRATISVGSRPSFGGDLTLNPTVHNFGSVKTGASSAPIRISIPVSGPSPVTITQITLAGVNAGDYRIVDKEACAGRLLQPGGNCGVEVIFTPTATNVRNASLLVNAGWGPPEYQCNGIGSSTLFGTGVAP